MTEALRHFFIDNVQLHEEIGRGGNGVVYAGSWQGSPCAVKKMELAEIAPKDHDRMRKKFLTECERSSTLRHPNIVQFFGVYNPQTTTFPTLIMERLHSNLTDLLKNTPHIAYEMKLSFIHDVAKGLTYLHTSSIIHRDLSTNNVLVSAGLEAKIGDLGTMRFIDGVKLSQMTREARTVDFMPPEVLFDKPVYGTAMDVFSFACVCLHTLSHKWPTPSQPVETDPVTHELRPRSEVQRRETYMEGMEDNVKALATSCLHNAADKRPKIDEVCAQLEQIITRRQSTIPTTLLDAHLSIEVHSKEVYKLQDDVRFKEGQITSLQELVRERETEFEAKRKEVEVKDREAQQNAALIRQQISEKDELSTSIRRKNGEIEHLGGQIAQQQTAIRELEAKLPSRDIMQLTEKSTNYWRGLKVTWDKVADPPVKLISCCAVEIDGDVYVSGRSCYTQYVNVLHYSQTNKTWSILNHLPCTHSSLAVVRSKSQLIAVGGIYADFETENDLEDGIPTKVSGKVLTWDAQMENWVNAYPDMAIARCSATAVGHESTVIVAGGVTGWEPSVSSTQAVEVMNANETTPSQSEWSMVQCLPYPSSFGTPLIINDQLYIVSGYSGSKTTCGVLTATIPALLTSKKDDTSCVWDRISDLPHDSLSISDYKGHLIVFGGKRKSGTRENGSTVQYQVVSPIHLYNTETNTWDYVEDNVPQEYRHWLGCGVHLDHNKIMFVGGASDPNEVSSNSYLSTCVLITINKK